jgi:hypothetical protein
MGFPLVKSRVMVRDIRLLPFFSAKLRALHALYSTFPLIAQAVKYGRKQSAKKESIFANQQGFVRGDDAGFFQRLRRRRGSGHGQIQRLRAFPHARAFPARQAHQHLLWNGFFRKYISLPFAARKRNLIETFFIPKISIFLIDKQN